MMLIHAEEHGQQLVAQDGGCSAIQDNPRQVLKIWNDIRNGTEHANG
jgi:hypothetical protein